MAKLGGNRQKIEAEPCGYCGQSGIEPGRRDLVCSKCGGVQYINANAASEFETMFDEHDSLRVAIKLLRRKDRKIRAGNAEISRLRHLLTGLQKYMDKKAADDLREQMYPTELNKYRATNGNGGYGD